MRRCATKILMVAFGVGAGILVAAAGWGFPTGTGGGIKGIVEGKPVSDPSLDSAIVVNIDGRTYTRGDLLTYARQLAGAEPPADGDLSGQVEAFVLDQVIYDDAISEFPSLGKDPVVRKNVRRFLARVFTPPMLGRVREEAKPPSIEQIVARLPEMKPQYVLSVVVCRQKEEIDRAAAALNAGKPFEEVARTFSQGFRAEEGGRIQPVEEGDFEKFTREEFSVVSALKEGEISNPFLTRIGWMIARLDDYRTSGERKRDEAENNYQDYKNQAAVEALQKFQEDLRKRAKVIPDKKTIARVQKIIRNKGEFPHSLEVAPLARVNENSILVEEISVLRRSHSADDLEGFLERRINEEVLLDEALRRSDPDAAKHMRGIAERYETARAFFRKRKSSIRVTPQEMKGFYTKNPQLFLSPEARKITVVLHSKREEVEKALRRAAGGEDFRTVAAELNEDPRHRQAKGEVGFVTRRQLKPDVAESVFSAARGAVLGPYSLPVEGGGDSFLVVKVDEIAEGRPVPFEKIDRTVLADKIVSGKMAEFTNVFLKKAYANHDVRVFSENLRKGAGADAVNGM